MTVSPNLGAALAEDEAKVWAEAEIRIIQRMVDLLKQGVDIEDLDWGAVQLGNLQKVRAIVVSELAKVSAGAAERVQETIDKAYSVGAASALSDLSAVATATSAVAAPATREAVAAISEELLFKMGSASNGILRAVNDVYQQVVGRAVQQSLTGTITRKDAAQAALNELLGRGILLSPETGNGRMNLTDYVTMAVRTGAGNAAIEGHVQAMLSFGLDLVVIQLGPRPCDICDAWGGMILTLGSGGAGSYEYPDYVNGGTITVEVEGSLEDAKLDGWGHPNDRCALGGYVPGATEVPTERVAWDKEGYEAQQRQRTIERYIRDWKTKESLALDEKSQQAAADKVSEWQAVMREHLRQNEELKRQSAREQIGKTI